MRRVLTLVAAVLTMTAVAVEPAAGARQPAATGPAIQVNSSDDVLALPTRLVFSTVGREPKPAKTFVVRNVGSTTLTVSSLTFGGENGEDFQLVDTVSAFSVPAGGAVNVNVQFRPKMAPTKETVVRLGTLTIASNDPARPSYSLGLGGLTATGYEGPAEPTLPDIVKALGYSTNVGALTLYDSPFGNRVRTVGTTRVPVGDELISPYWRRADTSQPVQFVPVAHYSLRIVGNDGAAGWFGPGVKRTLYQFQGGENANGGENQKLMPKPTATGTTTPTLDVFGLFAQGDAFSDDAINGPEHLHNMRIYPAKGPDGRQMPNTWLAAADTKTTLQPDPETGEPSPKNFDLQDQVILIKNITPALATAPSPGDPAIDLNFSGSVANTLADKDGEGTGFTSVQPNTASNEYVQGNLDMTGGNLRVTSTAGTNTGGINTQQNAVQTTFNATRGDFQVHGRLLGAPTYLNSGHQQQAIFFGPDQNNFLKLEIEATPSGPSLSLWREQNGGGGLIAGPTRLPDPGGISTFDMFFKGNLANGAVRAFYRINSTDPNALVPFGPGGGYAPNDVMRWFSANAHGGVLTSNQSSPAPFTAVYDRFGIDPPGAPWEPNAHAPIGHLDVVSRQPGRLGVAGWGLDPDTSGPIFVHVYVDGVFVKQVTADQSRPDIASAFPGFGPNHGYNTSAPITEGNHVVCIFGINTGFGQSPGLGCRTVVVSSRPFGHTDSFGRRPAGVFVTGWAIDPDTADSVDVHFYVDGVFAKSATADASRPDVNAAFGYGDAHGFANHVPVSAGNHTICTYGINVGAGGNQLLGCTGVAVSPVPFGRLDTATRQGGSVAVGGWAIDPDTSSAVQVHIYVDGRYVTATSAGQSRPDVEAVYPGYGSLHGYGAIVPLGAGAHSVCTYAINLMFGTSNAGLGCKTVA